jgi:hypothetical protein
MMKRLFHRLAHWFGTNDSEAFAEWVELGVRMRVGNRCLRCGERTDAYDALFVYPHPAPVARVPCGAPNPYQSQAKRGLQVAVSRFLHGA